MSKEELKLKILAIAKLLDGVTVSGYTNLAKVATAINELKNISNEIDSENTTK